MNIRPKSNKMFAVGLLLLLGAYCLILTLFFKGPNLSQFTSDKILQPSSGETPTISLALDYEQTGTKDATGTGGDSDVKGVKLSCSADMGIKPQLICNKEDGYDQIHNDSDVIAGGNGSAVTVENDAEIKLVKVYAPEVLFTGAYGPYDNVVSISNPQKKTAFRNASAIVNSQYDYLAHMPPGMGNAPGYTKEPFQMNYKPDVTNMTEPDKKGQLVFDAAEQSGCPTVVNGGDFNPIVSNRMSDELVDSVTPPAMELKDRSFADSCKSSSSLSGAINLTKAESELLCVDVLSYFQWQFKPIADFDWLKWLSCTVCKAASGVTGSTCEVCDKFELVGIWVDAPFGSSKGCNEEDCSTRYTEAGQLIATPPSESQSIIPSYAKNSEDYVVNDTKILTTPCVAMINGSQMVETKCLWDISVWQHMYQIEAGFNQPGDPNLIDNKEYWKRIEKEIKYREVNF